jgi:methyltransferase
MVTLVFLALLVAERLVELLISRRNVTRAFARGGVEVGRLHYGFMAVFHGAFIVACWREALPFDPVRFFGLLPFALGAQALRYWAIRTLGERWNTRVIVLPDAEPVTGGPYRFMRHPNYLAVCIEFAVVPLMLGAYVTAVAFSVGNALLLWVRIRVEEKALGPKWEHAFAGKRRLLPGAKGG